MATAGAPPSHLEYKGLSFLIIGCPSDATLPGCVADASCIYAAAPSTLVTSAVLCCTHIALEFPAAPHTIPLSVVVSLGHEPLLTAES